MLSSNEIKNYEFKKGIGYSKRSVDDFIAEIVRDYEALYKENIELKDKATALSEGLQYYKSIEKTLQKALVLAQKASDEEQENASKKARIIEKTAHIKADEVLTKAKSDLDAIFRQTDDLNRRFELYKSHVKNLIATQLDLINSDAYNISVNDLEGYLKLQEQLEDAKGREPEDIDKVDVASNNDTSAASITEASDSKDFAINNEEDLNKEDIKKEAVDKESEIQSNNHEDVLVNKEKISSDTGEKDNILGISKEKPVSVRENLINRIPTENKDSNSNLQGSDSESFTRRVPPVNVYRNGESGYEQNT